MRGWSPACPATPSPPRGAGWASERTAKCGETTPGLIPAEEELEVRAIVVRETFPAVPSEAEGTLTVVYDGELADYTGGLGMFDEGEVHVCRTALVNLTPHEIVVRREDGSEFRIPPSGVVARVTATTEPAGTLAGVPVVSTRYGEIEDLPAPRAGVQYIVSSLVRMAATGRTDLVSPDTGPESAVRDGDGRIVAVRRFTR